MSLTRSGLYHPVLTIKTIPPWIVIKLSRKSHFTISKKNHPRAPLLLVVEKNIRPVSKEYTESSGFSYSGLQLLDSVPAPVVFAGLNQLLYRRFHQ